VKQYTPDLIRNVAIVGHGGAGKTMLVEHMLYTAGAIERVGSIESGNTQSDHDPLETKRKISISASITPLEYHGHKINVVDVPGFPDFAGDLNAVAEVVGSFIFVVDAKSDLDVGFDLAWEVAEKHNLAKCIFINKLERDNADYDGLIETLHQRYGRRIVNVQIPLGRQTGFDGVVDLVQMKVYKGKDRGEIIEEIPADLKAEADERHEKMMEAAAEGDDNLSMKFLEGNELTPEEVEFGIMEGTLKGAVVPVLLGSAHSGIGVATLLDRIIGELPSPVYKPMDINGKHYEEDPNGPLIAYCFKTTADPYVGKLNYFRIFSGTLKTDAMVLNSSTGEMEKVHNLYYPHGKSQEVATEIVAGDLCVVAKLANTHTGDTLSQKDHPVTMWKPAFPDPVYRVAIEPATKADEDKLGSAMERLLEEDPTLRYTRDAELHQELLEGLGDIHIDTAIDKLKQRFGVTVKTKEAKVPYRETVRGSA
jgi:elongation factor G